MARSLHKVQKQIAKKRGVKPTALHENSRDAGRLRQAGAREDKLARIMKAAHKSQQHYGMEGCTIARNEAKINQKLVNRIAWFQEASNDSPTPQTDEQTHELVLQFIAREDEELAEIQAQQRPGRPKSKAEEQIQQRIDAEQREYKSGFWMPEMRDDESIKQLQQWGGRWAGLNTLTFVRAMKGLPGEITASSFPPKGLS